MNIKETLEMKKSFTVAILAFVASTSLTYASTLNVTNENKKPIHIKIVAEGDSSAVTKLEISAERVSSFQVSSEQLNGKKYFSIKGDTSSFTPGGKCEHLNVEKNYAVTFQDDKMGTTCIAEEVTSK